MSICDYHNGLLSNIILGGFPRVLDEMITKAKETHEISVELVEVVHNLAKRVRNLEDEDSV